MKQIQVIVECDPCMAWHGTSTTEGVETVAVSGEQTLDLCPDHRENFGPFIVLVAEWGASPQGAASTKGRTRNRATSAAPPAEVAPGTAPTATNNRRGGKRARTRRANAVAASTPAPGSFACPLCATTPATPAAVSSHLRNVHGTTGSDVYGTRCPVCPDYTSATGRALGIHGTNVHHVAGLPGLFAMAHAEGDPHGVIASRAEAVGLAASR